MVSPLLCVSTAFASNCDPSLQSVPALYEVSVQIRGQNPVRNTFTVATNADLIVFARERGADVTLEVLDSSGQSLARADNPIRRTAVQRVALSAHPGQRFYIEVIGKDHADSKGSVDLRVVDLRNAGDVACRDAQQLMAKADAAYAVGQAVTRAVASGPQSTSSDDAYNQAADGYGKAAERLGDAEGSVLRAQAELARATLFNSDTDNFAEARDWAARAARSYAALHDDYGKARAQAIESAAAIDVAVSTRRVGTTDATRQASVMLTQARDQLSTVAAFHARRHELYDQAQAQNYIGIAFYFEGRYDEAIRAYQKSLPLYENLHERAGQAQVLQNVALVEYDLGRVSTALPHYHRALSLIVRNDNPQLYAAVLNNAGLANWAAGNEDLALRQYGESLAIARTIQDTAEQHTDLHNIASVYARLGDQTRALDFYSQALTLRDAAHNARARTATLRAMANILRQQGQAQEALKIDREALSLATTAALRNRITIQIAKDLIDLGRTGEAAENLESVLSASKGEELDRAHALQERARLRVAANDLPAAEADLRAALNTYKTFELPADQFAVWVSLAELMHQRAAVPDALLAVDQALALAEEVRLQSANPELRSTLLQPLRPAFDLKIAILFEQYATAKGNVKQQEALATRALETAEQARARALADYQTLEMTAPGLDPALLERRRTLYRELATRRFRLETRLDRTGPADAPTQAIRSEIASLRQELDQIDAKVGKASQTELSRRGGARKSAALHLNEIPTSVAVIEYWLGTKSSYAWVITRSGITLTQLGASTNINNDATALHTALRDFGKASREERLAAGERLYARVLAPIETQIAGLRTLIFAPDGALHYVPFATLRRTESGRKVFLVESYDIAVTPSIQMFLRPEQPRSDSRESQRMLLVDDPVYDPADPRVRNPSAPLPDNPLESQERLALVRGGGRHLPRLPGAAREAAAIVALMPAGSVDRLDGFAANRERFLTSGLGHYKLIHVASHATTDSEIPQASALILSTVDGAGKELDGRVYAADFLGVRLHADTVVLSACETALGKQVAGEGLIGLQYIVLARGARSVVSSLWPALDRVTAEMMVNFYTTLLHQHSTVISAWSTASRAALDGRYADPGTWGAFMLTLSHVEDVTSP
jgi:CHAT domain-containing protein